MTWIRLQRATEFEQWVHIHTQPGTKGAILAFVT